MSKFRPEMATRRDEARRGELNVRRVKLVPNSPRLVDWTPHLASPRGEARRVASCRNVLITQISRRNCILYVTENIDAGAVSDTPMVDDAAALGDTGAVSDAGAVSDTRWWVTRGLLVTPGGG